MTMIDEDFLTDALRAAGDDFVPSKEAVARILADAVPPHPPANRTRTALRPHGRRVWLAAAASVIALGAVAVPLVRGEPGAVHTSALGAEKVPLGVRGTHACGGCQTVSGSIAGTGFSDAGSKTLTLTASGATPLTTANSAQRIESTGTVALSVTSGHVADALTTLAALATSDGGLVDSTNASGRSKRAGTFSHGTIVVQVPQPRFAELVAQVQKVGRATSVVTSSNNVTAQYVNLQARVNALQVSREQYLRIMTRATTITGILAVQNQIDNLQSQIEQDQGQLKVVNNETSYGSLTVRVGDVGHHATSRAPRRGFAKAWHDSVSGFVAGFEWLVRLAGPVLFAALVLGALYVLGTFSWRAYRRRRL